MALAQTPGHGGDIGMLVEKSGRLFDPARQQLTVAIDELDIANTGSDQLQPVEPGIARAGSRERHSHVQIDHRHATLARPLRGSIV